MPVNLPLPERSALSPVAGVQLGITEAGIKKANRKDVLVITLSPGTQVAGVFTLNRFCAAPVQLCRAHLDWVAKTNSGIRALVVNTGNANAGTGEQGMRDAYLSLITSPCSVILICPSTEPQGSAIKAS